MSEFDGREFARSLSTGPGVYVMRDAGKNVLYVGKARNLRRRVGSYFVNRAKGARIDLMVRKIASIDVSLTRTEAEALLLENEWIKSHKPRFNINLRDDKSYPWIRIDTSHPYPRIGFYRGNRSRPGRYFGPYSSAGAVRESLNQIYRLMGIRQCRDSVFSNRSRPCLQYQIKRCSAPCVGYISEEDYARDVEAAAQLLKGQNEEVIEHLRRRMNEASEALEFEKAAAFRDHIRSLQRVRSNQYVTDGAESLDVIALVTSRGQAAVQVVEFRQGRNIGGRCFFPGNLADDDSEARILSAFLGQYYAERIPPVEILMSSEPEDRDLWEEALASRRSGAVTIRWRVRSQRAQWVALARTNAEDALRRRLAERDHIGQGLNALAELVDLPSPPAHMECFDISHISGTETVASCVVFGPDGAQKKLYRHYNIEGVTPGDDYAAMEQVLTRRYRRLVDDRGAVPDLIVIDGGKGQTNRAREVLSALGLDAIPILGVAKGPSRKAGQESFVLGDRQVRPGPHHPASHLIQQIRDEAHRFAITGHRRRRQKRAQGSPLEQISGVGPQRRQTLLTHFGGLKGLKKAGADEIARLPGISTALAERIAEALRRM
jgi:excinuclease ABC subunit C